MIVHILSLKYNIQISHGIRTPDLRGRCFRINPSHRLCCYFFFFIAGSLRSWKYCSSKITVHRGTVHRSLFATHIERSLSLFLSYLFFCKTSFNMSKGELIQPFTQDEIKKVRSFPKELDKPTCTSLAYKGTSLSPLPLDKSQFSVGFNASDEPSNQYWILDYGAIDHMTPLPTHFSTYSPCPSNKKISTADGSLITVAGQGNVQISPTIILQNVLHIPKLSTSLISIQKLTKYLSCNVVFCDNACVFQDKDSGKTIWNAREWNGIYYFDNQNLISSSTFPPTILFFFLNQLRPTRRKSFCSIVVLVILHLESWNTLGFWMDSWSGSNGFHAGSVHGHIYKVV